MTSTSSSAQLGISRTSTLARLGTRLKAHRMTILVLVTLIVLAGGIRLLTFDGYLPVMDHRDESNMYLLGRDWRGVENVPVVPTWLAGYPPLYIWMNIGIQQILEAVWPRPWILPSDYLYGLRLVAVLAGVITTLLVCSIGWQLAGKVAGWLAGIVWALSPAIVQFNNLAIPDPMVYLTCAASITMALAAWRHESPGWLTGSLIAAIAAIYLKYPAVYSLLPWGVVAVILTIRHPRRMAPWMALQILLGLVAAAYLVFGYGALTLSNREANTVRDEGVGYMLDSARQLNNLRYTLIPVGEWLFAGGVVAGVLAYVKSRIQGWRTLDWKPVALLLAYVCLVVVISAGFSNVSFMAGKIRHVLPGTVALSAVWAALVAQVWWTLRDWSRAESGGRMRQIGDAVLLAAGAALVVSYIPGSIETVQEFRKIDMRQVLWQWADVNVPLDGRVLAYRHSNLAFTWNRPWSGYNGSKPFEYWLEDVDQIVSSTPERFVERGIPFFVMNDEDREVDFTSDEAHAFIDQLTLIKRLPVLPDMLGTNVYFYKMLPPQVQQVAPFGEAIRLVGYDLDTATPAPGATLTFRPYWRADQRPATNYSMFVHLYPADRLEIVAQHDSAPASEARPTLTWTDPEELYIGSDVKLDIPETLEPGAYRLAVGLYDFNSGQRLVVGDSGEDHFTIPITVQPPTGS